jgi:hypothetical protein
MSDGEILYSLNSLADGDSIKVYSKSEDVFRNEKIEIYTITKEKQSLYLVFEKNTSVELKGGYYSKDKVVRIGVSEYNENKVKPMGLTKVELKALKENWFEDGLIRKGYSLEGTFDNGFDFKYPNIVIVTNSR